MSKRSHQKRKERMKRSPRPSQRPSATADAPEVPEPASFTDELIEVPKETSKLRFVLTVLLIVFLLLVFAIPSALLGGSGGGGSANEAYLKWTTPGGADREVSYAEWKAQMSLFHGAFRISPFAAMGLGITDGQPDEHELARLLVIESMADEAGVEVTMAELGQHLRATNEMRGMTPEVYKEYLQQLGGPAAVEVPIRRALRAARFLQFVGQAGALPDPAKVQELWEADHEELAFDYISLPVEDMKEEARKALPDDEALSAWLEEQPESDRDPLMTPERRSAEIVYFTSTDETPAAALLTEYPAEAERTPEEAAEEYYNRVYFTRFQRSEEDLPEGEELTAENKYLSPEEVQERTLAEAPVYFAMQRWLSDLQGRQAAGEEIDLAADAERLGLGFTALEADTREALAGAPLLTEDENTDQVLNYVFQAAAGGFGWSLANTKNRLVITRTVEVEERALPPLDEIRDQVVDLWLAPEAEKLATERLQALWEGFEEYTKEEDEDAFAQPEGPFRRADADAFRKAAEDAGLKFGTRDYVDKGGRIDLDPNWEEAPNKFIATHREFFGMDTDEVAPPKTARDKTAVYLVRMAGKRPVPISHMKPGDLEGFEERARSAAQAEVGDALDYDTLVAEFDLWLLSDQLAEEQEESGADADAEN